MLRQFVLDLFFALQPLNRHRAHCVLLFIEPTNLFTGVARNGIVLPETISESVDRQMDAEQMDVDVDGIPLQNGVDSIRGKRKARKPTVKEEDSDEELVPKVRAFFFFSL